MRAIGWKRLLGFVLSVLFLFLASELGIRLMGFQPRIYTRPYDPVFVSGMHFGKGIRNRAFAGNISHPSRSGYEPLLSGIYVFDHQAATSGGLAGRTDFIFSHPLSRYKAGDIDRIVCAKPGGLNIFVVGGSAAQGAGASSARTTWHALLEQKLRKVFKTPDIHVFNAAIGGFNSLQERLTYELAVLPREPDIVLVLDGFNDVVLPLNTLVRPGDPYQTGIRFTRFYGNSLVQWLAETSALAEFVSMQSFFLRRGAVRERVEQNDEVFGHYRDAVTNAYMRNTEAILEDCEFRSRLCLVALQPFRAISHQGAGVALDRPDVLASRRWTQVYEHLKQRMGASAHAARYLDMSAVFSARDRLGVYTDYVHFNDRGSAILAEALTRKLVPLIRSSARRTGRRPKFCQQ